MILVEKEWTSFGFKFATRADHGGCIGAIMKKEIKSALVQDENNQNELNSGQSLKVRCMVNPRKMIIHKV